MSLLARVKADFVNLICNADDFAESFSYTPAGSGSATTLTGPVIPQESRVEERNGFLVKVDRIHVSNSNDNWSPAHGSKVVWDGRTWDFANVEHDRGAGFCAAYFESQSLLQVGPITVAPL